MSELPEYVGLAEMEIHTAPEGHITIRPHANSVDGQVPLLPCQVVLTQQQARALAQDLLDAADQSAEEAKERRN